MTSPYRPAGAFTEDEVDELVRETARSIKKIMLALPNTPGRPPTSGAADAIAVRFTALMLWGQMEPDMVATMDPLYRKVTGLLRASGQVPEDA